LIQNAIESNFELKDSLGRYGKLQSRDGVLTLNVNENDTLAEKMILEDKGTEVQLPDKIIKAEETVETVDIAAKREAYNWPKDINKDFENDVLDWFIVDSVLTPVEQVSHLLNLDWSNPPYYAKRLITQMKNGKYLYILGSGKIYNNEKKLITPVGDEQDAYRKWINEQKNWYMEHRNDIYASMSNGSIVFYMENDADEIKRSKRSKVISGKQCSSYLGPILNSFVKWLSGDEFPEKINKKEYRCIYADLLVRRAILDNKEGIFWIPPQIYEIFLEDEHRSDLIKRLK
jgi:hypothetical protein